MKNIAWISLFILFASLQSCNNAATNAGGASQVLPAAQFAESLKQYPDAVLLDVRTPEEFAAGHLENAQNANINDNSFAAKTAALDKSKPVYVYCLSGGRSATAANFLREKGFKTVVDLQGGIMKWRAAKLPLAQVDNSAKAPGMTQAAFDDLLKSPKLVLIDFYAPWCQPCKRMAPYLEEIKNDMGQKVEVVRINADESEALAENLSVTALPTLILYKNAKIAWRNEGFIEKADVVARLKAL